MINFGDIQLTRHQIDTATGLDLDSIALRLNIKRGPIEADKFFRDRTLEAYNAHPDNNTSAASTPSRIKWKEGMMFIKKGQEPDSPALYKVLHPGQLGGDVMFVVRLDTGEESLYSKDLHPVILSNADDVSDRLYRAEFALIVNRVQNGDLPMSTAFNQARQLFAE